MTTRRLLVVALTLPFLAAPTAAPTLGSLAAELGLNGVASELADSGTAAAANIRRNRFKQRNNGLYKSVMVTEDDGDGESAASTSVEVTYTNEGGESVTTSEDVSAPAIEKVYLDWTPPAGFSGGTVLLACEDCGPQGFADVPLVLGAAEDWDGDNEEVADTTLTARAWRRGDGSYRFRLKGSPADVAALNFSGEGSVPTAQLIVDGDVTTYQFTREVWRTNLDIPANALENQTVLVESSARDASGAVLDSSLSTTTDGEGVQGGLVIDRVRLTENGAGNLKLRADVFTDQQGDDPSIVFEATSAGGETLLSLGGAAPTHREWQFTTTFELIEPDNFVDQEYLTTIDLLDANGGVVGTVEPIVVVAGEVGFDVPTAGTNGDLAYHVVLTFLEDEAVGSVTVTLARPMLDEVASLAVTLEPNDGGTELDEATAEATFLVGAYVFQYVGSNGAGGLGNGETVTWSGTVAGGGDFTAPLGEVDLAGGQTDATGTTFKKGDPPPYLSITLKDVVISSYP